MESITTLGQWVKCRRRTLDMTQDQLAQRVGCSSAAIKKIESDERRPSRQMAGLLAAQLRLSPEQRPVFVQVARRELPLERLPLPREEADPAARQEAQAPVFTAQDHKGVPRPGIPHPATPLIGRERELAEITRLVQDPQCRLLTLTGIGGTGKTRLAVEAALKLKGTFADGVYFVPLAGVDAPAFILPDIIKVLGIAFSGPGDAKHHLFHYLQRKHMLLVLDNLEHLLDGVQLFSELLQFAPDVKLLATSREQLHLQAEWLLEVRGLPVPQSAQAEAIEASSAVRLFLQRSRQTGSDFQAIDRDYSAIRRICQLVQGLPLAIELAARWTRVLSCAEIAQEIERGLAFLTLHPHALASREISDRHRSLQAVFDHSWDLLSEEERQILKRLSVFRAGFCREAAEQVAGANLFTLSALIDKSLLWRSETNRYALHELVRQYLADRLAENAVEEQAARSEHSRYYLALLQTSEAALRSQRQKYALAALDEDMDNIHQAWHSAVEHGLFDWLCEAGEPLYYDYELHQYFQEAETLFRQASDQVRLHLENNPKGQEQDRLQVTLASLVNFRAFFQMRMGSNQDALTLFDHSLSILRIPKQDQTAQRRFPLAFALVHTGVIYWTMGDFEQAARYMQEGLALSRTLEQTWLRGQALGFLGAVAHDRGDYPGAYERLHEAMNIVQAGGDPYLVMFIGIYYSRTLMTLERLDEARTLLQEGLRDVQATGNRWLTALGLEYLARIARLAGDDAETRHLLEESVQLHREVGDPWSLSLALMELSRYKLQCEDFDSAEALALEALKMTADTRSAPATLEGLGILAAICAKQGLPVAALILIRCILLHPSSRQDTRDQAEMLQKEIAQELSPDRWEAALLAAQSGAQPADFETLMQDRFGLHLPLLFP